MSGEGKDPKKKHRHDVGDVSHGPHATESVTRAIQFVLGGTIVATLALTIYFASMVLR